MLAETQPIANAAIVAAGGLIVGVGTVSAAIYANSVRRQKRVELIQPRLEAYQKLWALMEEVNPALFEEGTKTLTEDKRTQLRDKLRQWYFEKGNGIHLSRKSRDLLVKAKDDLLNPANFENIPDEQISEQFSALRDRMRKDIGAYPGWETPYLRGKRI